MNSHFQINYQFYFIFFTNFYISEMFLPLSQNVENRKLGLRETDVTQKRNIDLTWFLVQMLSRCVSTKLCLRIFYFVFQIWITS